MPDVPRCDPASQAADHVTRKEALSYCWECQWRHLQGITDSAQDNQAAEHGITTTFVLFSFGIPPGQIAWLPQWYPTRKCRLPTISRLILSVLAVIVASSCCFSHWHRARNLFWIRFTLFILSLILRPFHSSFHTIFYRKCQNIFSKETYITYVYVDSGGLTN